MTTIALTAAMNAPAKLDWAIQQLRLAHVRVTPVRERVLRFFAHRAVPATLNEISGSDEVAGQFDDATVYRTLVLLVELEVARQLQFRDRATCFVLNVPGECFSFLVCRCCGVIKPIPQAEKLHKLGEQFGVQHGYAGLTHELEIFGVCPKCQEHTQTCAKPSKFLPGLRLRGRANN